MFQRAVWPCRYDRVLVAETQMDASSAGRKDDGSPAGKGDGAFNALAKYIFGGNASGTKMQMTTPVFTDDSGTMQFVIDPSFQVGLGLLRCQQLTGTPSTRQFQLMQGYFRQFAGPSSARCLVRDCSSEACALKRQKHHPSIEYAEIA